MGGIKTEYDLPRDLTIVKATGKMTADDFRDWTTNYYSGTVTKHVVWDLTQADFSDISVGDVIDHVDHTKEMDVNDREGGKTAIVADDNLLALALSKVREVFVQKSDLPYEMRTFTTMDEALDWLCTDSASASPTHLPEAS